MRELSTYSAEVVPWLHTQFLQIRQQIAAGKLPHAILLGGDQFQGKTGFALAVGAYLLCKQPGRDRACGQCKGCKLLAAGTHPDMYQLQPVESRYIKVDEVRELINWASGTAQQGGFKVVLVKPAEAMNLAAANALLKYLEEPADETMILLVSDRPGRLLPTIRSRCQQIQVARPDDALALEYLRSLLPDHEDLVGLLKFAQGRPLKAVDVGNNNLLTQYDAIHAVMLALWQKSTLPHEAAANLLKYDPESVLEMLLYWLAELLRSNYEDHACQGKNMDTFRQMYAQAGSAGYFRVYDLVMAQRAALMGGSNPNKQMVLESVLVEFSEWLTSEGR